MKKGDFKKEEVRSWAQLGEVVTARRHAGEEHRNFGCEPHVFLDGTPDRAGSEVLLLSRANDIVRDT
jgi:hypothetical protein